MQTTKELPACPVETTLLLIGDKWKVLILRDLMPGTKRFGELKKSIGSVSQKVLTAQLRDMEESGLLTRTVYAEVPPRVEHRSRAELAADTGRHAELGRGVQGAKRLSGNGKKGAGGVFPRSSLPLTACARLPMRTGRPGWG